MLPEHSQQLLRAARAGRVYQPPAPPEDDIEMKDEEEESKQVQTGFTIKKFVKVPRHLEVSEPEYLAKRRKGLPSPYVVNGISQPALRETKVKKLDAEGNATVYKVLVPEGQAVEGEVQPTDAAIEAAPATAAPGTVVEGVGVVNAEGVVVANDIMQQTPPRRRHPPPKKKRAGPGRGKKKVVFVDGAAEQGTPTSNTGGDLLALPGLKQEGGSVEPSDGDTPMADAGGEDEEGEEGSEDEEADAEQTSTPATPATPARSSVAPTSAPSLEAAQLPSLEAAASTEALISAPEVPQTLIKNESPAPQPAASETEPPTAPRDRSSSPDLPLSTISHSRQNSVNQLPTSLTEPVLEPVTEPEPEVVSVPEPEAVAVPEPKADSEIQSQSQQEPVEIQVPEPTPVPAETLEPVIEPAPVSEPITAPAIAPEISPDPLPVPVPLTEPEPESKPEIMPEAVPEKESEPLSVPLADPSVTPTTEQDVAQVPVPEQVPAPSSEPDLMGSLERHLEKDSEDIAGS